MASGERDDAIACGDFVNRNLQDYSDLLRDIARQRELSGALDNVARFAFHDMPGSNEIVTALQDYMNELITNNEKS